MKRTPFIFIFLIVACVLSHANGVCIDQLCYLFNEADHTARVTYEHRQDIHNYDSLSTVYIPDMVYYGGKAYSVTTIDTCAFAWSMVDTVIIPYGVTDIEERAFEGCVRLVSLQAPTSLRFIHESAFHHCTHLTSVSVPKELHIRRIPTSESEQTTKLSLPNETDKRPVPFVTIQDTPTMQTFTMPAQKSMDYDGQWVVDLLKHVVTQYYYNRQPYPNLFQ